MAVSTAPLERTTSSNRRAAPRLSGHIPGGRRRRRRALCLPSRPRSRPASTVSAITFADDLSSGLPLSRARERGAGGEGLLSSLVHHLANLQPGIILGVGTTEADLAFAQEARRQALSPTVFALVAAPIEHFRAALGADADGFCGPSQWEPTAPAAARPRPHLRQVCCRFQGPIRLRARLPGRPGVRGRTHRRRVRQTVRWRRRCGPATGGWELDLTTFYGRFRLDPSTGQQVGHRWWWCSGRPARNRSSGLLPPRPPAHQLPRPTAAPTLRPSRRCAFVVEVAGREPQRPDRESAPATAPSSAASTNGQRGWKRQPDRRVEGARHLARHDELVLLVVRVATAAPPRTAPGCTGGAGSGTDPGSRRSRRSCPGTSPRCGG